MGRIQWKKIVVILRYVEFDRRYDWFFELFQPIRMLKKVAKRKLELEFRYRIGSWSIKPPHLTLDGINTDAKPKSNKHSDNEPFCLIGIWST